MHAKKIEEMIKGKVKKSKIQEIVNYFYYGKEFIKWLIARKNKTFSELGGKFDKRWEYILDFEEVKKHE